MNDTDRNEGQAPSRLDLRNYIEGLKAFSVVVHELGHHLADRENFLAGRGAMGIDPRGYADQAEFWRKSGFYSPKGGGWCNQITNWYMQSGGKNNSLFLMRLGIELAKYGASAL